MLDLKISRLYKKWLIVPALIWLVTQFAMTGAFASVSSDTMRVMLCSPSGTQQITIDLETGEPVKEVHFNGCEWCQSFGAAVNVVPVLETQPNFIVWVETLTSISDTPVDNSLWSGSGFLSRAPPL